MRVHVESLAESRRVALITNQDGVMTSPKGIGTLLLLPIRLLIFNILLSVIL